MLAILSLFSLSSPSFNYTSLSFVSMKVIALKWLRTFECKESKRKAFKLGLASAILLARSSTRYI